MIEKILIAILLIFAVSQQIVIRGYDRINDDLQTALGKCIGLKEGR